MTQRINDIKNFFLTPKVYTGRTAAKADMAQKNLTYAISPVQFARIRHDIGMWRKAIDEAEQAYYPHRVKMQRIFQDTILNEHVIACMERRKDLTLLRDFKICDDAGNESDELKQLFRNFQNSVIGPNNTASWFDDFMSYSLDATGFGYSLISLGDVENNAFTDLSIIPRQNVSPDRFVVGSIPYQIDGKRFLEDPFVDWHIYVPTSSRLGKSKCGYGYLYEIAKAEILIRNNTAHNADYNELFGQPIRKGTTTKTDEAERMRFEQALANMGSTAYILLDDGQDNIELVEAKNSGTTYNTYADFEKRNEQKISKVILGHADALDSIPGKLGGGQGDESPVEKALRDKQVKDGILIENVVNSQLFPRMRKHGFKIPLNYHFEFKNDQEKEEFRRREDDSNTKTAQLFKTIADAGGQLDEKTWKYFSDRTGIPVTMKEPEPTPTVPDPNKPKPEEEIVQP
jgi:phage gp29-like protein